MAYGFSYQERQDVRKIAKALDFPSAEIVEAAKGKWMIRFGESGKTSHSKGIPATQLKAWIDGAMSVLGIADAKLEAALEDHPLFRSAVRVAYARNEAERRDDIRELSHLLAKEFNAFNQSALI